MNRLSFGAIIWVVFVLGCGRSPERAAAPEPPTVAVKAIEITLQRTPDVHEVVGTVRAKQSAAVSARVAGRVEQVGAQDGDTVTTGQILALLDDRELRAEFQRAKADYERSRKLLDEKSATQSEVDAVEARFRVAEAALTHTRILAPFDGVVARKLCEVGDMATPGKALFVVDRSAAMRFEAQVPERLTGPVAVGKSAHVRIDATGEKCVGTVAEIVPAADPVTRTVLVRFDLDCRRTVRSGMFGRAEILVGERPAVFVQRDSVRQRGQLTFVHVIADGRAQMRLVKTGREYSGMVEVVAGLQPGERIVTQAEGELTDGGRVDER